MQRTVSRLLLLAAVVGVILVGLVVVLITRPGAPSCGKYALTQGASTVLDGGVSVSPGGDAADLRFDSAALAEAALADAANAQVLAAVNAMPHGLRTVGAVTTFGRCGESATPVVLSAPAPDPNLDAYAWDGTRWTWLGGSTDRVVAALPDLPQIVAWVESLPTAPIIGIEPDPATGGLAPEYAGVITELYAPGLTLTANGTLSGQAPAAPAPEASYVVYPVIGNWVDGQVDTASVQAMLGSESARKAHADALVKLATGTNFAGVAIDYRGLAAQWRDPYAALIEELAEALHASGRQFVVVVPEPLATGVIAYDTQGYDLARIGRAADVVQVEMPIDVAAYHAGGQAVAFLKWAGTQVNRSQMQPILSAASLEQAAPYRAISFADAVRGLAPSGVMATISTTAGTPLLFSLNPSGTLTYDASTGAYNYPFATPAGEVRRSVHTAATLSAKLSALAGLRLRGAMVRNAQGKQAAPGLAGPIKAYRQQAMLSGSGDLSVEWSVLAADGSRAAAESRALSQSNWTWTANRDGLFNVSATVASVKLDIARVTVGKGETPADVAGGSGVTDTVEGNCPDAAYVADVSVPDNTRFEKGKDFTKTWRVRNSGTCAWTAGTLLAFVSGSQLGATNPVKVGGLGVGKTVDISVPMKSGDQDGAFTGVWQLRGENGAFGDSLSVVIKVGVEVSIPPPLEPPAGGGGPLSAGIQGHFYGYVDTDAGAQKIAGYAAEMGLGWVKIQFRWGDYDYYCSGIDLNVLNTMISRANEAGLKVLLSVVTSPPCTHPWTMDVHAPPDDPQALAEVVGGLSDLFRGRIHAIEIWDKPNTSNEWVTKPQAIDAGRYTQLLTAAYTAIKAKDPNILVISGALEPRSWNDGVNSVDDFVYLQQLAAAGALKYADCVGARFNTLRMPASATQGGEYDSLFPVLHHSNYFKDTVLGYLSIGQKPVCLTEFGVPSPQTIGQVAGFEWANDNTQQEQADWIAEGLTLCKQWGCRLAILFNLDYGPVTRMVDGNALYSFIDIGTGRRPVFQAVRDWCAANGCR